MIDLSQTDEISKHEDKRKIRKLLKVKNIYYHVLQAQYFLSFINFQISTLQ